MRDNVSGNCGRGEKQRRPSRRVRVGTVDIGGGAPISIQGMTKCDTRDVRTAVSQIVSLRDAGCQIVRVAVPSAEAAEALSRIVRESPLPVVADVHFDYRLALKALEAGVHKIRINPGNIGGADKVRAVAAEAAARGVPIRVGVNAGSLERDLLERHGGPTAQAMVESARRHVGLLEDAGFSDIVISLKASSVLRTVEAYRLAAGVFPYPFHVGISETGPGLSGVVKSAVGLGILLGEGIGDTVRVSLTGDPVGEIKVARDILVSLGLMKGAPEVISCPTCGRCRVDLVGIAQAIKDRLDLLRPEVTVAVMGCEVNGPGEAREADVGVALGRSSGLLFKRGTPLRSVPFERVIDEVCDLALHADEEEKGG